MFRIIFLSFIFVNCLFSNQSISYFVDSSQKLTIDDMLNKSDSEYLSYSPEKMAFGFTDDIYWLKIVANNPKDRYIDKLIELDYATLDDVQFYDESEDGYKLSQYGDLKVHSQPQKFYKIVHSTSIKANSDKTIYIRVNSESPMILNLKFSEPLNYFDDKLGEFLVLALYYGLSIGLIIYNFFLFLGLREKSFLFYVFFHMSFMFLQLSINGIGNWLIWQDFTFINTFSIPLGSMFSAFFGLLFALTFLSNHSKKLYYIAFSNFLVLPLPFILSYKWAMAIALVFGTITTISVLFVGFYSYFKEKNYLAKYFLIAWAGLLTGLIILNLKSAGVLPINFFTTYASQIGATFEALLLSIALVKKYTRLQSENIKKDEEINIKTKIIYTDELTKVNNRTYYNEKIQEILGNYEKTKKSFSLVVFDIDHFKRFNDTYGHDVGDKVLIEMASLIKTSIRDDDIFARIGGEEFIIILPNTNIDIGYKVIEELRAKIDRSYFVNDLKVTCSFGVVEVSQNDTVDTIYKRADIALYKAKDSGRNIVIKA